MVANKFSRGVIKKVAETLGINPPAAYQRVYNSPNTDAFELAVKFEKQLIQERKEVQLRKAQTLLRLRTQA